MILNLKLQPYAESDNGTKIDTFDEEEWEIIADLHERLVRNFKQSYPKVNITKLDTLRKPFIYIDLEKEDFLEEEAEYYIEILSGFNDDNIIFFDDEKYSIRCILIEEEEKEESFLERFNNMVLDFASETTE